jgi:dephospho-CoA kinase
MIRFGLTGGIATGKSVVARYLRERHGVPVADADQMARDAVEPGSEGLVLIGRVFGSSVILPDGSLDRSALGRIVAADPVARERLEAITHPEIYRLMKRFFEEQAASGQELAGVEASLLVETGRHRDRELFDLLVVVTCTPETQLERLLRTRSMTKVQAWRWIASQLPLAEKERVADILIRSDGTLEELADAVALALVRIRRFESHAGSP